MLLSLLTSSRDTYTVKNKVKATGTTVCTNTTNQVLGDFSSIGSGDNNKAEGEYSSIPCGRNNKAKGKGSIVFGHNRKYNHNNALHINIPIQSGKVSLNSTSAASLNASANRFLFLIETTLVKITQDKIGNIKEVLGDNQTHNIFNRKQRKENKGYIDKNNDNNGKQSDQTTIFLINCKNSLIVVMTYKPST